MGSICFVGELLKPALGIHGDMQQDGERRRCAYFYAQESLVYQLLEDGEFG